MQMGEGECSYMFLGMFVQIGLEREVNFPMYVYLRCRWGKLNVPQCLYVVQMGEDECFYLYLGMFLQIG